MSKARQLADLGNVYDDGALSNRNLIINGAMQVAQRGTSTTSTNVYLIDRFKHPTAGTTQYASTTSQDTDAPSGFSNSLKVTTTTAETTIDAGDLVYIATVLEGYDLQRLGYGTSDAKTATLSFWVKSSVTGTYCVGLYQYDGPYTYTTTYTINAANTWEYKTITLSGNTSGSITNDNTSGIRVSFILAAGSTYNDGSASNAWESYAASKYAAGHVQNGVVTTLNATWQITGVQLEVGDTATPFEHRSYGDELARCQRYYERWDFPNAFDFYESNTAQTSHDVTSGYNGSLAVAKRALPSFSREGTFVVSNLTSNAWTYRAGTSVASFYNSTSGAGRYYAYNATTAAYVFDAEL